MAVCQTREDQQSWIDTLRQQIRAVLHKSSSPKSPLPPPHVSGKDLPPASPYARLTEYFANLVHAGIITRPLLKKLLYRQFSKDYENVGILGVKVRRNHKVECVIFPQPMGLAQWQKASIVHLPSDSSEEALGSGHILERQDAFEISDSSSIASTSSSPFSLICYMPSNGKTPGYDTLSPPNKMMLEFANSKSGESSFEIPPGHQPFPPTVCQDLSHISEDEVTCRGESRFSLPPSLDPIKPLPSLPIHTWHSTSTVIFPQEKLQRTHSSTLELTASALSLAEITFDPVILPFETNRTEDSSAALEMQPDIPHCLFCSTEKSKESQRMSSKSRRCKSVASVSYVSSVESCECCPARPLSPRSSDSGLADITSPDLMNSTSRRGEWLHMRSSQVAAEDHLPDCDVACSRSYASPSGSAPPTSAQHSLSDQAHWNPHDHKSRLVYRSGMYAHWGLKMHIPATSLQTVQSNKKRHHRNPPQAGKKFQTMQL